MICVLTTTPLDSKVLKKACKSLQKHVKIKMPGIFNTKPIEKIWAFYVRYSNLKGILSQKSLCETFSAIVLLYIYADMMGGSVQAQKCANVIYGWPL